MAGNNSNHRMNWSTADIPSQEGRVAAVTGANSGIGWPTALELARAGSEVILTVRSEGKGRMAVEGIRQLFPRARVRAIVGKLFKKVVDCSVKLSPRFGMPRVSDMKKRLTDAALDLMWENSYGTTSVDAICERARAKKGSFYYFFKSKSELTVAALEAEWNKNKANMDALFSPTIPPLERFDRYFDYVHDRLAELQKECGSILGCPLLSIGSEVSTQDQGVRAAVDRIWDRKIKYFESAIRDAHAQGLIVAPDPEAKARALFACYHGTLAQARIQNDVELIRDFKQVALDVLGTKHVPAAAS